MGFWVCLWGNIFTTLTGLGRPAHRRWHHSLAGILSRVGQKRAAAWSCCPLRPDCGWAGTSGFTLLTPWFLRCGLYPGAMSQNKHLLRKLRLDLITAAERKLSHMGFTSEALEKQSHSKVIFTSYFHKFLSASFKSASVTNNLAVRGSISPHQKCLSLRRSSVLSSNRASSRKDWHMDSYGQKHLCLLIESVAG